MPSLDSLRVIVAVVTTAFQNNAQIQTGQQGVWMVDGDGKQKYGISMATVTPNWLLPEFAHVFQYFAESVADTFCELKHFKGLSNFLGPAMWPDGAFAHRQQAV